MFSEIQNAAVKPCMRSTCSVVSATEQLQLTGDAHLCVLIDGTLRKFLIARVSVDTSCYKGELEAMCTKASIYYVGTANIPRSYGLEESDQSEVGALKTRT